MNINEKFQEINDETIKKALQLLEFSNIIRISRAVGTGKSILVADLITHVFKRNKCRVLLISISKVILEQYMMIFNRMEAPFNRIVGLKNPNEYDSMFENEKGTVILITSKKLKESLRVYKPQIIIYDTVLSFIGINSSENKVINIIDSYVSEEKKSKAIYFDSSLESLSSEDNAIKVIVRPQINSLYIDQYRRKLSSIFNNYGDLWQKLQPNSKTYLVTAEVLFSELLNYGDKIDYSPVVIMWMKALELEIKKYFYDDLKKYLNDVHLDSDRFPNGLKKTFTLGNLEYVLRSEEYEKCQLELNDYFENISTIEDIDDIKVFLESFKNDVEVIRKSFRNKASHTEDLQLIEAIKCYQMLLFIEKVFIRLLSFVIAS